MIDDTLPETEAPPLSGKEIAQIQGGAHADDKASGQPDAGVVADVFGDDDDESGEGDAEQLSAQAIANGIPASDGYRAPTIEGVEWSEADQGTLRSFFGAAHKAGLPQTTVDHLAGWYTEAVAEQEKTQRAADADHAKAAREALARDWGAESYKTNLAEIKTRLAALPADLGTQIRSARTADGKLLVNTPGFLGLLIGDARKPPTTGDRKAYIERVMKTDIHRYWREGLDKEHTQILAQDGN